MMWTRAYGSSSVLAIGVGCSVSSVFSTASAPFLGLRAIRHISQQSSLLTFELYERIGMNRTSRFLWRSVFGSGILGDFGRTLLRRSRFGKRALSHVLKELALRPAEVHAGAIAALETCNLGELAIVDLWEEGACWLAVNNRA